MLRLQEEGQCHNMWVECWRKLSIRYIQMYQHQRLLLLFYSNFVTPEHVGEWYLFFIYRPGPSY